MGKAAGNDEAVPRAGIIAALARRLGLLGSLVIIAIRGTAY